MNIKWNILKLARIYRRDESAAAVRNREPLDHPALSRMTLAQLADLPIPSYVKENCNSSVRVI